ncbi:XRE family transcriptional regulator [Curtobacterium pusillum]|uniref:Helix-turn-helix domain-containing protein n=1 Tax=Curtobacterium pusillum TaxID=69373 RepID=A0ABX2MH52_9MICO|nr:helix-turn-helix domain-containing protein [Curtobacterium pusillum]NUU15097.1 helix-turn-helix domain-containing protein [Curtobacterium pusillum]GLK31577.1 XRE family transcriptional regulator [Curtobacterium pusillum]
MTSDLIESDSSASDRIVDGQSRRIGEHIRALRRARSLTLVQLAELTGLSHPFLSQVERGHSRASMVSLEKIAGALSTSQVELLAAGAAQTREPDDRRPEVLRAGEGARGPFSSGEARLLVHGGAHAFEPLEWVGENTDLGPYFEHHEDEFLYVLGGAVLLDLGGDEAEAGVLRLGPGDSAYYRGGTPHRWCSPDGSRFHLVVVKETPRTGATS